MSLLSLTIDRGRSLILQELTNILAKEFKIIFKFLYLDQKNFVVRSIQAYIFFYTLSKAFENAPADCHYMADMPGKADRMQSKVKQKGASTANDTSGLTVNERILKQCHKLYADKENGKDICFSLSFFFLSKQQTVLHRRFVRH